jgi:homoserine/homoserine lactone efflux protein
MSLHTWLFFALAYLITTITPGPNVLLVIRNTVRYGVGGTAATVAGNLLAQFVVVMLVALGVGSILAAMPPLFIAMKVIGAIYLMYLGVKQLRGQPRQNTASIAPSVAPVLDQAKIFRESLFVSGSNPKTLIFLSAFMPQFIVHDHPLPEQFALMYLTVACIVMLVHSVYSFSARGVHGRLGASPWMALAKRCSGLIFVGLGVKLLTAKRV